MSLALENELAHEFEFEQELNPEASHEAHEFEFENEAHDLIHELSHEQVGAHEQEQEMFFNHLAAMADRGGRSQALRKVALAAARRALRSAARPTPIIEGEFESGHHEMEVQPEFNPARRAHLDAQLEHLGHAAAEAEHEHEAAEHFLPLIPLVAKFALPLAAKALPLLAKKVAPVLAKRIVPNLTRGIGQMTRFLYRQPSTRPLIRAVPQIARQTVISLARRAANGRSINPQLAARALAYNTFRTLSNPRQLTRIYRVSATKDHRFHTHARRALGTAPNTTTFACGYNYLQPSCPSCGR